MAYINCNSKRVSVQKDISKLKNEMLRPTYTTSIFMYNCGLDITCNSRYTKVKIPSTWCHDCEHYNTYIDNEDVE